MRLVQLIHPSGERRAASVEGDSLRLLESASVFAAILGGEGFHATAETLAYLPIYAGESDWRLLPPIDHPEPARCLISGTGLTHTRSAANRDAMHSTAQPEITDSMRMYRLGVERGKPARGEIGAAPEWFYKGNGAMLRGHNQPLEVPAYAEDGGEEPEIAGVYAIDAEGAPRRIGMAQGNEFSDHSFERKNYLNLAGSKLRTCSIGPELVLDPDFMRVSGNVAIERAGRVVWSADVTSGEEAMCHSLANIEHHHFKFEAHRRPGDVHVHFFGASAFSFGAGVVLENGDIMQVRFEGFGRPLRNPVLIDRTPERAIAVQPW
jgi:hypothetical protein